MDAFDETLDHIEESLLKEDFYLKCTKEFLDFFETHEIPTTPTIPEGRKELRINLIEEEVKELKQAIADGNLVEIVDAFCDIQYVLSGAINEFGMADKFAAWFEETHRSNMSKACKTLKEADQTKAKYWTEEKTESYIVERNGLYFVYRSIDHKLLKSINYSPVTYQGISG